MVLKSDTINTNRTGGITELSETIEKPMTVKEYAAENHISQQSVYSKISRNSDKLKGHVSNQDGKILLDKTAQEVLKPIEGNCQLASKASRLEKSLNDKSAEYDKLTETIKEKDCRIENLEKELSDEKAKTAELEKRVIELTDKSLAIADMRERLNALFSVLEENANTGMGKKFGNLLTGKH